MGDEERRKTLEAALREVKLEIREDSILCRDYIGGKDDPCVAEIVQEMATMHYLYDHTDYKADLEKVVQYLIRTRGAFRGLWRYAAQHVKLVYVARGLPDEWPW
jgi:hypothetical protein